jgi:FlaA1/EpsC-like NDP-sugar epimerase
VNLGIRTLSGLIVMAKGKADYEGLHELDIYDLLAREPAGPNEVMLQQ